MTADAYWGERSSALEQMGLDPEGDAWALPDNDEYINLVEEARAEMFGIQDDPWFDNEEDA